MTDERIDEQLRVAVRAIAETSPPPPSVTAPVRPGLSAPSTPSGDVVRVRPEPKRLPPRRRSPVFVGAAAAALVIGVVVTVWLLGAESSNRPASETTTTTLGSTDAGLQEIDAFLRARIDGVGAEAHVADVHDGYQIPLLYATTSGSPYERYEFAEMPDAGDADGRVFRARLYADGGQTVVEQYLVLLNDMPGIAAAGDYWLPEEGRRVPGTTENGVPLTESFEYLDGAATFTVGWRWGATWFGPDAGRTRSTLILDNDIEERFSLMAFPAMPVEPDCSTYRSEPELSIGPAPRDAAALAEALRTEVGLIVADPLLVPLAGVDALQLDIELSSGPGPCGEVDRSGQVVLWGRADPSAYPDGNGDRLDLSVGHRMRLFLVDLPGMPGRILTVAVDAGADRFDTVLAAATPMLESLRGPAVDPPTLPDLGLPGMSPDEPAGDYGWTGAYGGAAMAALLPEPDLLTRQWSYIGWMHHVVDDPAAPEGYRETQISFAVENDCFPRADEDEPVATTVAGLPGLYLDAYEDDALAFRRTTKSETTEGYALFVGDRTLCVYVRWDSATTATELSAARAVVQSIRAEAFGPNGIRIVFTLPPNWDRG